MRRSEAVASAIERGNAESVALCLLVALARALAAAPPGTIDDLLALLAEEGAGDARES